MSKQLEKKCENTVLYLSVEAQGLKAFSSDVCITQFFDFLSGCTKDPLDLLGGAQETENLEKLWYRQPCGQTQLNHLNYSFVRQLLCSTEQGGNMM